VPASLLPRAGRVSAAVAECMRQRAHASGTARRRSAGGAGAPATVLGKDGWLMSASYTTNARSRTVERACMIRYGSSVQRKQTSAEPHCTLAPTVRHRTPPSLQNPCRRAGLARSRTAFSSDPGAAGAPHATWAPGPAGVVVGLDMQFLCAGLPASDTHDEQAGHARALCATRRAVQHFPQHGLGARAVAHELRWTRSSSNVARAPCAWGRGQAGGGAGTAGYAERARAPGILSCASGTGRPAYRSCMIRQTTSVGGPRCPCRTSAAAAPGSLA
jgi:hypothetical protein